MASFHENLLLKHHSSPHHHHLHLNHDNSTSTSPHGTLSSTSSSLSNASSNSNNNGFFEDVKILLPNGLETVKRLDTRKAIYDILIELAASSKLQPSGYTLQLYSEDMKILDYTVTQTLAQIAPNVIKLVPKASTIKAASITTAATSAEMTNKNILNNNSSIINTNSKQQQQQQQPSFEITIRVQVNLPHNQITAVRVKPNIRLTDLLKVICDENLLDANKYKLFVSNSSNFDANEANYMNNKLSHYESNEVTLIYVNTNNRNSYLKQQNNSQDQRLKNCQSNYSVNSEQGKSEFLNRSKSEIDLHDENNNNYNNSKCDEDPKGTRKSSILNLFRKKHRSRSKNMNEETSRMKISSYNEQSEQHQQQQTGQDTRRSSENIVFNTKKKHAPPPPPVVPVAAPLESQSGQVKNAASLHQIIQTHKKKQAPPPPPSLVAPITPPQQATVEEQVRRQESSSSSSSLTNSSSAATIKTNNTAVSTSETVLPPVPAAASAAAKEKLNSPSNATTQSIENDNAMTNSLTSSLASSKNFYQFDNNSEKQDDIQSVSDIEEPVFTKEKSIYNEKQTVKSEKYFDESSSISNNSKSSSIEDVSKAFAITIAIAEQYISKDEALKGAAAAVAAANRLESLQKSASSPKEYKFQSNRVKAYNGAIVDKNTTMNSTDDFCDVEVNINLMPNEQIEKINNNYRNKTSKREDIDDIDANRRAFVNEVVNENNREIEVIYESFHQEADKKRETSYYDSLRRKSVKEIPDLRDDYEENRRQSSVIYTHNNLPSPPLSFSNAHRVPKQQSLDERKIPSMSPISTSPPLHSEPYSLQRQVSTPIVDEHTSYKVIRPSDVYQKDGAYYSHDGTIRGYLGKVKKMTTSKVLSEIFTPQHVENDDAQHQPTPTPTLQPKIMQPPTPVKTTEEKLSKNNLKVIHTSTNNAIVESNKPVAKVAKSSLMNIIQSEKKQHQMNTNMYNSSVNNMKTSLASSSETNVDQAAKPSATTNFSRPATVAIKRDVKPTNNVNLANLQQNEPQVHHQQKISTSFVMSAKSKTNSYQAFKKENESSIKDNILSEIKSTVPLVEEYKVSMRDRQATPPPPPLPDLPPPPFDNNSAADSFPLPPPPLPPVAPKNFKLKTINNVPQILPQENDRSSLLNSIKGFNASLLRKTKSSN